MVPPFRRDYWYKGTATLPKSFPSDLHSSAKLMPNSSLWLMIKMNTMVMTSWTNQFVYLSYYYGFPLFLTWDDIVYQIIVIFICTCMLPSRWVLAENSWPPYFNIEYVVWFCLVNLDVVLALGKEMLSLPCK